MRAGGGRRHVRRIGRPDQGGEQGNHAHEHVEDSRLLRSNSLTSLLGDLKVNANPRTKANPSATTFETPTKFRENTIAADAAR